MSILGLSKQEIDDRFDEVVEFAEIGDAIDSPVQTYSSGMAARLGFASAIHTEPDILLIDEVLAVGDIKFRAKCNRRLIDLRQKGTSFILVSHQTQSILNVCDSAVYLLKGQLIISGETSLIMTKYEEDLFSTKDENLGKMYFPQKSQSESLGADIISLYFRDKQKNIIDSPLTGNLIYFCVKYRAYKKINCAGITIDIQKSCQARETALVISSFNDKQLFQLLLGESEIWLQMPYLGLKPGLYSMKVYLRKDYLYTFDCIESFRFRVTADFSMGRSSFYQPRCWKNINNKNSKIR